MNIKHMIVAWIDHRIDVVRRRTRFELKKAEARAHILEGYLKAIDNLDEIVKIIRSSDHRDQAKASLIESFSFTEKQAHAVLDLRLYQLTGLERSKIEEEYQELLSRIEYYRAVLASDQMVRDIIKEELEEVKAKHKSPRRTQIIAAEDDMQMEDLIANEQIIITISQDDYIKRMPVDTFRAQRRGGSGVAGMAMKREDDVLKGLYVANTHDYLLAITTAGRIYWLKVWQVPETGRRSKGKPLINLLEDLRPEERVATVITVPNFEGESSIVMATEQGVIKKTELSAFSNPRKKGIWAISIDEEDRVIGARLALPNEQIMLFTRNGMAVRFGEEQVRAMGRMARGVKGVSLRENDRLVSMEVVADGNETVLIVCENGYGKRSLAEDFRQTKRGGVGVRSIVTSERNGLVVGALSVTDEDGIVMMSASGQAVRIGMKEVRVMGRATQGVRLANLKEEDRLVAVAVEKLDQVAECAEEGEAVEAADLVEAVVVTEVAEQIEESNHLSDEANHVDSDGESDSID